MKQIITTTLYGASFFRASSGDVISNLYCGDYVEDEREQGAKGICIMQISCDEAVYQSIDLPPNSFPVTATLECKLRKGAKGKMVPHCTGIQLVQAPQAKKSSGSAAA